MIRVGKKQKAYINRTFDIYHINIYMCDYVVFHKYLNLINDLENFHVLESES